MTDNKRGAGRSSEVPPFSAADLRITPLWLDGIDCPWPGYPAAVSAAGFCFVGALVPYGLDGAPLTLWSQTEVGRSGPPAYFCRADRAAEAVGVQASAAWRALGTLLESRGSSLDDVVRERYFQRDKRYFPELEKARILAQPDAPAPSVGIGVSAPGPEADAWFSLDAIAIDRSTWPYPTGRELLRLSGDLAPLPTYNTALRAGPFVFSSGQIAIDTSRPGVPVITGFDDIPSQGRFLQTGRSHTDARNGLIAAQTWFVYDRRRRMLDQIGLSNADIVELDIYLADIRDFVTVSAVHDHFFPGCTPAVTVSEFTEVGHKGTRIETQLVAYRDPQHPARHVAQVDEGDPPRWRRAGAVAAGPLVFTAGQAASRRDGRPVMAAAELAAPLRRGAAAVARATGNEIAAAQSVALFDALDRQLAAAGAALDRVVKLDVLVDDFAVFPALHLALEEYGLPHRPALTVVKVPRPSPVAGACVCVAATAVVAEPA